MTRLNVGGKFVVVEECCDYNEISRGNARSADSRARLLIDPLAQPETAQTPTKPEGLPFLLSWGARFGWSCNINGMQDPTIACGASEATRFLQRPQSLQSPHRMSSLKAAAGIYIYLKWRSATLFGRVHGNTGSTRRQPGNPSLLQRQIFGTTT